MTAVDVVVPVWNSLRWLGDCLESLRRQTLAPSSIIVVDDGSTEDTSAWISDHAPGIRLVRLDRHSGFAAAANRGIEAGGAPLVALLNVDTRADADWLESLVGAIDGAPPEVGSVASMMLQLERPEVIDNAGDVFTCFGSALKRGRGEPADRWQQGGAVLSASAGAALYRRTMLDEIGSFDESFESYLEDVELGLRARLAGYQCVFEPAARVLHQGGGASLPRPRYVRLVTANRLATVLHGFPAPLLARHGLRLLWGQWYFLVASRHPWHSFLGYCDFARRLPAVLARRREIQSRREIGVDEFDRWLERSLGEPPLRHLIRRRLVRS